MRPLLRLLGVEAKYGRFVALSNVSLAVPEGSVVALLGPNGVGKTTLLRTVSGMLTPTSGEIQFDGARIDGLPDHAIARMGLAHIPEGRGIFPGLSVRENLQMAAWARDGAADLTRVNTLFPVLAERSDQLAGTLSGGEQQMLSLARAVITEPRLLMVDELSLGLAPILVNQLFDTLEKIRAEGTTILLVEQYVRYALRLADIVVVLHKGKVVFIGEPGELGAGSNLLEAYLGGRQAERATPEPSPEAPKGKPRASAAAIRAARRTRTRPAPRGSTRRSSRA